MGRKTMRLKIRKKIKSAHICTPVNSHFYYLNKYIDLKKIIVEKPFLKNLHQLKKIQNIHSNKNLLLLNYTYLFNPILNKLKKNKYIKFIKLKNNYDNSFYKKNYNLIINSELKNYITKKFFSKKIEKNYDSFAYTFIIFHVPTIDVLFDGKSILS